jgi:hypothetical protein
MRSVAAVLILTLVVTLGASGCQTISENPKTAVGTGVGAAGGALLGGLIGRNTTGVVVGGLLGALAGGAIGYYLERQDKTAEQARADTGYQPAQGTVVRVERVQTDPASVSPGGTVKIGATYTVLTPNATQTVTVNETREVRVNGALVANPTTSFTRANGTFTSALPITLPADAVRGTYEVTTTVAVGDRSSRGLTTFVVR